jgi:hypothetical protein
MHEILIIRIAISRGMEIISVRKIVNLQGTRESIPPACLAWRDGVYDSPIFRTGLPGIDSWKVIPEITEIILHYTCGPRDYIIPRVPERLSLVQIGSPAPSSASECVPPN